MPEPIRKLPTADGIPARDPVALRGGPPQGAANWRSGPAAVPRALAAGPDLPGLLKALRRRWMLAVSVGVILATSAAGVLWMVLSPKYVATAQVLIGPS